MRGKKKKKKKSGAKAYKETEGPCSFVDLGLAVSFAAEHATWADICADSTVGGGKGVESCQTLLWCGCAVHRPSHKDGGMSMGRCQHSIHTKK